MNSAPLKYAQTLKREKQLAYLCVGIKLNKMNIKDFKKRKNRQRPDFAYGFTKKEGGLKYDIVTLNGGKTFLCSIDQKRLDGRYYNEFSETHDTIEKCLAALESAEVN